MQFSSSSSLWAAATMASLKRILPQMVTALLIFIPLFRFRLGFLRN